MKKLRYFFIVIVGLFFFTMLMGVIFRNIYLSDDAGKGRLGFLAGPLKSIAEIPLIIKQYTEPPEFYVKNDQSSDGLTFMQQTKNEYSQKLLASYKEGKFASTVELLDLNSGKSIKKWSPDNLEIFRKAFNPDNPSAPPSEDSDLYFMHPLMLLDSSIIVNSQISSLLARINAKSELVWIKNDRIYHHSIEMDADGFIYTGTRPFKTNKYDFLPENYSSENGFFEDDHITKIDPESGEILFDKSVIDILLDNGYEDLLLAKGQINSDPIHLNDIQPAIDSTAFWHKGDLLVSLRNLSAIMLYRPETNKILWLKSGPWFNQHDADFIDDSKILVFGNDVIREESVIGNKLTSVNLFFSDLRQTNNAYLYDLENDSITTPFRELFRKESIRTYTSGRCDLLSNGDIMIEDTNNGRIVIGDSISKKIEFVKRLDQDHISHLSWSRIIN